MAKNKALRVAHSQQNMIKELNILAHSCGVKNAGLFQRKHAKHIVDIDKTIGLEINYT